MDKKELDFLKKQLSIYNRTFKTFYTPDRDTLINDNKRHKCIELMQKSCKEKHDYVSEYYHIDIEHRKKHYDLIID